jgi:Tfp pilus assembly protein PilF
LQQKLSGEWHKLATRIVAVILILQALVACTTPKPLFRTDQYHADEPELTKPPVLNGLQLKALQLMNQQQFEQSLLYLQRAVKVEPRNALNWHYMAQNYWHLENYSECRSMIKRAQAYSQFDADLQKANQTLLQQCTP